MDVATVTSALGFTRNYWWAVENDRTLVAADKLRRLIELLDFDDQDRDELLQLRAAAKVRGWWDSMVFDEETRRFIGLESGAVRIRAYDGLLIPGLLQTESYARSIIECDPAFSPVAVEEVLDIRRKRQERLTPGGPLELSVLVSEACLVQQVGGPSVQAEQLLHLERLIEAMPDVLQFRVLPFAENPGIIANSSTLVILDFGRRHLPTIAYQESVRSLEVVEYGDDQFRRLELAWKEGRLRSLNRDESLDLVRQAAVRMGKEKGA